VTRHRSCPWGRPRQAASTGRRAAISLLILCCWTGNPCRAEEIPLHTEALSVATANIGVAGSGADGNPATAPHRNPPVPTVVIYPKRIVELPSLDLTLHDLTGIAVSEDREETRGGFVHLNIDNDNDSDEAEGAPRWRGADLLETVDPVTGEDDLTLLSLSVAPLPAEGRIVLSAGPCVRLWRNREKGASNLMVAPGSSGTWDLYDPDQREELALFCSAGLYVEGVMAGTCPITAEYQDADGRTFATDTVEVTCIAADCGSQPSIAAKQRLMGILPALVGCEWTVTGPADSTYNCMAWSVGETDHWYNAVAGREGTNLVGIDEAYGNHDGLFDWSDLDAFYWTKKGYLPLASGPADAAVIYYAAFHGAVRRPCGCGAGEWLMFESKCGAMERIEHVWDQVIPTYGEAVRFYR
jgi:hypothetical protein